MQYMQNINTSSCTIEVLVQRYYIETIVKSSSNWVIRKLLNCRCGVLWLAKPAINRQNTSWNRLIFTVPFPKIRMHSKHTIVWFTDLKIELFANLRRLTFWVWWRLLNRRLRVSLGHTDTRHCHVIAGICIQDRTVENVNTILLLVMTYLKYW